LGIDQVKAASEGLETCICSIDKDLDQIPGWHLNFVKELKYEVTPQEGLRKFYHQLLTGDLACDNIPGLKGIGPKKADKALDGCLTEEDMFNACKKMYQLYYPDSWEKVMLRNGQLLKIRTREGEVWEFPSTNPSTGAG
jgi:5'-3' exonuclease